MALKRTGETPVPLRFLRSTVSHCANRDWRFELTQPGNVTGGDDKNKASVFLERHLTKNEI